MAGGKITKHALPIFTYDGNTVSAFLRSVAFMVATSERTKIEWETYRDSKVLNAIYALYFWKEPPGTAQVRTGSKEEIHKCTDELHNHYMTTWISKLMEKGVESANKYLDGMLKVKQSAYDAIQFVYSEARDINNMVIGETNKAIRNLAAIKLGAQIGVAVIGAAAGIALVGGAVVAGGGAAVAGGGTAAAGSTGFLGAIGYTSVSAGSFSFAGLGGTATAFTVVGTTHSVTHAVIKEWENGGLAIAGAVSFEGFKTGLSEGGSAVAKGVYDEAGKLLSGAQGAEAAIANCQKIIRRESMKLAEKGFRKKTQDAARKQIAKQQQKILEEEAKVAAAAGKQTLKTGASVALRAIPIVFAAWDSLDAVNDYRDVAKLTY